MVTTPRQSDDTAGAAREPGLTALAGQLNRELRSLVERVRHFSAARWAAAAPPFPSRAEVAFHLAQVLAAASLAAAGMPARVLPRLDDTVLPDQLAVTGDGLLDALAQSPAAIHWRGSPQPPDDVAAAVLAEVLLHRIDLDGSPPPAPALAALRDVPAWMLSGAGSGKAAVAEFQRRGRERCRWA